MQITCFLHIQAHPTGVQVSYALQDLFLTTYNDTSTPATDKRNTLLVARVASLLPLHHKPVGYVGPLSRHLHGYTSLVNVVRSSLRDLLEVTMTTLLLNGDADRDVLFANNAAALTDISLNHLPCAEPGNCGLGIAMKDYLDHEELAGLADNEVTDARKQRVLDLAAGQVGGEGGWFSEAVDLRADLKTAWQLWDKVSLSYVYKILCDCG